MAVTAGSMILRALQIIGEKRVDGTLTANEKTAYVAALNSMMDSWSIDRSLIQYLQAEHFSLVAGTASYTIGSGGTFNTVRPSRIEYPTYVRDSNNYDQPCQIITYPVYETLVAKQTGNTYPAYIAYDAGYASGLGTIYLYPKPAANLTLYIHTWKPLQSFTDETTALAMPPGYQRAIEFNFAVEICPGYINLQPEAIKIARESLAAIKRLNSPDTIARLDDAASGRWRSRARVNIITGP